MGRRTAAPFGAAIATAALLAAGPGQAGAAADCRDADLTPTAENLPRVEAAMVCLLNIERRKAGRKPVARDRRLERSALRHTRDMIKHRYFAHRRRGGPTLLRRIRDAEYFRRARSGLYSENLGYAPPERATAASLTRAFALSEAHRATMLHGRFRDLGIGSKLIGPDPAFYADYPSVVFTIDFGRRYERRRRPCRPRASVAEDTSAARGRSRPPRPWCPRRRGS